MASNPERGTYADGRVSIAETGAALVEFALMLPLVLLFLVGTLTFIWLGNTRTQLGRVASEALATCARSEWVVDAPSVGDLRTRLRRCVGEEVGEDPYLRSADLSGCATQIGVPVPGAAGNPVLATATAEIECTVDATNAIFVFGQTVGFARRVRGRSVQAVYPRFMVSGIPAAGPGRSPF